MARGGSRGTKGGGVSVNPINYNRYNAGYADPRTGMTSPEGVGRSYRTTGIVAGGPNPYGRGNGLGSSSARIINDMRKADMFGYQGLPQQRPQPQPFRPQFEPMPRYAQPMYSAPYQPQPMPFRAPSPGKGGSKGGGMNVPPMRQPMPMMENPLGNRGMMRTMEMRPGRDYIPFMPRLQSSGMSQIQLAQKAQQGLGGFFT